MTKAEKIVTEAMLRAALSGVELAERITDGRTSIRVNALTCLNCQRQFGTIEEAQAHDAECPEHPLMKRLLEAEAASRDLPMLMLQAFVDGAKWWEFEKTGATMWPADQRKAEAAFELKPRYAEHVKEWTATVKAEGAQECQAARLRTERRRTSR